MVSNRIEPTCIYCRSCIPREYGYECYAFRYISYLSPQHARACKYFELPGVPCRTMKKNAGCGKGA